LGQNPEFTNFPKPEDYFSFFVGQTSALEEYLLFLKDLSGLSSSKEEDKLLYPIFHKLFEFYLDKYTKSDNSTVQAYTAKNIMTILSNTSYESKYDEKHVLLLFKIFNFAQGIVHICEKLKLREELLDYYIENEDDQNVIDFCRKHGAIVMNLWVQALCYFATPTEKDIGTDNKSKRARIPEILEYIKDIDPLSPLLVLNICAKEKNVSLDLIKGYFKKKIDDNELENKRSGEVFHENYDKSHKNHIERKKLLSQGKVFQNQRCDECESKFASDEPRVYFMCGHAYHARCISDTKKDHYECTKCLDNNSNILQTKEDLKSKVHDLREFMGKMDAQSNKFDVVCEFLGRGLFAPVNEGLNEIKFK